MEERHFVKNDQGFVCAHCGQTVEPLGYTSRNHCPHCLYSLHVDIHPGDRQNPCRGLMEPVGLDISAKKAMSSAFAARNAEAKGGIRPRGTTISVCCSVCPPKSANAVPRAA